MGLAHLKMHSCLHKMDQNETWKTNVFFKRCMIFKLIANSLKKISWRDLTRAKTVKLFENTWENISFIVRVLMDGPLSSWYLISIKLSEKCQEDKNNSFDSFIRKLIFSLLFSKNHFCNGLESQSCAKCHELSWSV